MRKIGLRVDVDTFKGTREGVPRLLKILQKHKIKATFFFSVGPDNMGRHLWRLLKPSFLWKMLRSNAVSLYGLEILLHGTFCEGPLIGEQNKAVIRECAAAGHEIGVHCWDHQYWQAHCEEMSEEEIYTRLKNACDVLESIIGYAPSCSGAAGFKCTDNMLRAKERLGFRYNADCRGSGVFVPRLGDVVLKIPQVTFNLPTYDEVIGSNSVTNDNYNQYLLGLIEKDVYNALTIHAEVEGGACAELFEDFLEQAKAKGMSFWPFGALLPEQGNILPEGSLLRIHQPGREGWVSGCVID